MTLLAQLCILAALSNETLAQWAFNGLVAGGALWAGIVARRAEKRSEKLDEKTQQVIDERMATLRAEVTGPITQLVKGQEAIIRRLESGDARFENNTQRDHALEIKIIQAIETLRTEITERFASRKELDELGRQVQQLQVAQAKQQGGAA